jgi:AraC-like DNA-binding protein
LLQASLVADEHGYEAFFDALPTQQPMKLFIKYMVSARCLMVVKSLLEELQIPYGSISLGEVEVLKQLTTDELIKLRQALKVSGLEVMENKKSILVERIKQVIIEMVHYAEEPLKCNFSEHLSRKLNYDYTYLSNLFTEVKGTTIEQFIIAHKIERVKELIIYDELTLSEIADKMHYSSVGHMSNQFKRGTGLSPSFFKKMRKKRTINLDDL